MLSFSCRCLSGTRFCCCACVSQAVSDDCLVAKQLRVVSRLFCCCCVFFVVASPLAVRLFCYLSEFVQMTVTLLDVDKVHERIRPTGLRGMIVTFAEAHGLRGTIQLVSQRRGVADLGDPDAGHRSFSLVAQGPVHDIDALTALLDEAEVCVVRSSFSCVAVVSLKSLEVHLTKM